METETKDPAMVERVEVNGKVWFKVTYRSLEYNFNDILTAFQFGTACSRDYHDQLKAKILD